MLSTATKAILLALVLAATGCATTGSQELGQQLHNAKKSDHFLKEVVDGRIVSVRVGARGSRDSILELGSHSGNAAVAGVAAMSHAASLIDSTRTVFWITYKAKADAAPKVFHSFMVPSRPDLYTEGTLFRHIKTKDGYEYLRRFDSEEEFNKFYE